MSVKIPVDQAREIFDRFDTNGNGTISVRELYNAVKACPAMEGQSDNDVKACCANCLKDTDKNDDDCITWEEFKNALCE